MKRTLLSWSSGEDSQRCLFHCSTKARFVSCRCGLLIFRACTLGVPFCKRMKQISHGKQGETKNSTPKVYVVTDAVLLSPVHPRKQVKCFGDMSQNHYDQTSCA